MAKFHGKTNLHLGEPEWASAEWDSEAHDYVIDVSGDDLKKFRSVAADYGFSEEKAGNAAAADDSDADDASANEAAPAKKATAKKAAAKSE